MTNSGDEPAIDALVTKFYSLFDNREGKPVSLEPMCSMVLPQAVMVRGSGTSAEAWDVGGFVASRTALLNGGGLTQFSESEVTGTTLIWGGVAQRVSTYRKSGVIDGHPFSTNGVKVLQFARTEAGWRIAAVAWQDDL